MSNLSEEERIKRIDASAVIQIIEDFYKNRNIEILGISVGEEYQFKEALRNILALYNKEKEKNKELELCLKSEEKYSEGLNKDIKSLLNIEPNNNFVSKDKIKDKIKECEKRRFSDFTLEPNFVVEKVLEELLEEEI